jgi:hypothetical protein
MTKRQWTLGIAVNACLAVAACGGADGSDLDPIGSESAALTQSGDLADPGSAPAATTTNVAEAASCTATSDGGKWCCVPISTPPGLKCTYTAPPPPPTVLTAITAQSGLLVVKKLQPN